MKVGYEISFNRYCYKFPPKRSLEDLQARILVLAKETKGLLTQILEVGGL